MASSLIKATAALALVGMSVPAAAQTSPPPSTAAATEAPQGIGLWIGILMSLVVVGVAIWHDELFDDDEPDVPVSP